MSDRWRELARRITAAERKHRQRAEELWNHADVMAADRERWIADGLERARDIHLEVAAESRDSAPDPLDSAMHSIWLHGKWRDLTAHMTTEEREAAADAVDRHHAVAVAEEPEHFGPITGLRWWRDA